MGSLPEMYNDVSGAKTVYCDQLGAGEMSWFKTYSY